jgi:hypothetical protein
MDENRRYNVLNRMDLSIADELQHPREHQSDQCRTKDSANPNRMPNRHRDVGNDDEVDVKGSERTKQKEGT